MQHWSLVSDHPPLFQSWCLDVEGAVIPRSKESRKRKQITLAFRQFLNHTVPLSPVLVTRVTRSQERRLCVPDPCGPRVRKPLGAVISVVFKAFQ